MPTVEINANTEAIDELTANIKRAKKLILERLVDRADHHLKLEVPVVTNNLRLGIGPMEINHEKGVGIVPVTGKRAMIGPRQAVVVGADGKERKRVTLKPSPAFNYAPAVARGRPSISPKNGKALLIPVPTAPSGEGYLIADGQIYIVRRSAKAVPPNPFDERAAKKLEAEAVAIGDAVLKKLFK